VLENRYDGFRVTAAAALIGGLAGLSGDPLGVLMGAVGGALIGVSAELTEDGEGTKVVARISKELAPGSAAVVAGVAEEGMSSFEKKDDGCGRCCPAQALETHAGNHCGRANART